MSGATVQQSSLHKKLAEVMAAVGYIPKNGDGPGYKFAAATDVADKVRDELAKRNVTFTPVRIQQLSEPGELTISGKQKIVSLLVTWQFTDADTGETHQIESVGTGADSTDKSAPKAQTNALKYAFLMGFSIPTGDDPEADRSDQAGGSTSSGTAAPAAPAPSDKPLGPGLVSEAQRTKLLAKAKQKGLTESQIKAALALSAQVKSSKELTVPQFEALLGMLDDASFISTLQEVKTVGEAAA